MLVARESEQKLDCELVKQAWSKQILAIIYFIFCHISQINEAKKTYFLFFKINLTCKPNVLCFFKVDQWGRRIFRQNLSLSQLL